MSKAEAFLLTAIVADHERPVVLAAAEQLSAAVAHAQQEAWPIRLRFLSPEDPPPPPDTVIVTSLAIDLERNWSAEHRESYWRTLLAVPRLGPVLLCNLFRHVQDRQRRPDLMQRIRQLNMFAIRLSRETGLALVDLDRRLALQGVRPWSDGDATRLAALSIAESALACALDNYLPPEVQRRAAAELLVMQAPHMQGI